MGLEQTPARRLPKWQLGQSEFGSGKPTTIQTGPRGDYLWGANLDGEGSEELTTKGGGG